MSAYQRITAALEARGLGRRGGRYCCPAHDDRKPSLSVDEGQGCALVTCHAGCEAAEIMSALGFTMADLYDEPRPGRQVENVYPYLDAEGRLLYEVVRFGGKQFSQRRLDPAHPDADRDGYVWSTKGIKRVLYRLPAVHAAVRAGRIIYFVEGEKDVRALESEGEVATTNAMGAAAKVLPALDPLRGSEVVIVRDQDEKGREHAERVRAALTGVAASVRVVDPAQGKDAHDHLAAGLAVEDFLEVMVSPNGAGPAPGHVPGDDGALERGDLLIADRFVGECGDDFLYVPGLEWHRWTGAAWRPCELGEEVEAAKGVVRRALGDDGVDAKTIFGVTQAGRVRGALELAAVDPAIALSARLLDADPFLLATPGGIVDLRTGELRPARRADLVTKLTACAPAAAAGSEWIAFLECVQTDPNVRGLLQRLAGRSLVGREGPRVLPINTGDGANGKSTFTTALRMALGEYARAAPLSLLMADARRPSGPTPELVELRGRRFVVVSESPEDGRLAVERVKALTGGDAITARALYRNLVTFEPTHTVWLATNHRPRVPDAGPAIWDRLLLIPWPVRIEESQRVERLGERLAEEDGPGILRWAIDGAVAYLRDGLAVPESIRAATRLYREREDVFASFLAECTDAHEAATVTAGALLRAYRDWGSVRPTAPALSDATLAERMAANGFPAPVRRAKRSHYIGLRLLEEDR